MNSTAMLSRRFKSIVFISGLFLLTVCGVPLRAQTPNPDYDSTFARKMNGNDNGMKRFYLAILKTGSNTTADKAYVDSMFAGHMKNIQRLADDGKLVIAGPLGKNLNNYRGIFIFNTDKEEEAKAFLASDPAVNSKLLDAEVYMLWSSAALQALPDLHKKLTKFVE